jgi:lycopene cyclase domain-containing protein
VSLGTLTYAQFLLVCVVPPIVVLAIWLRRRMSRRWALGVAAVCALAVAYTGPWDHFIIEQGVWSYPPGRVLGPTIGNVPVEEYAFFLLQVTLTSLGLLAFTGRRPPR